MKFHRFGTKLTAWILSCALLLPYAPAYAHAADLPVTGETADGLVYSIQNGSATITGYTGASDTVHIPSEIGGCPVQAIGGSAFSDCTNLSSVTMPEGLLKIESGAFWNCDGLTAVQLPDSVTTLGGSVFCYCDNLETVNYPLSLTTAAHDNYSNCPKLTSITVPEGVTRLADYAFAVYPGYSTALTAIRLPSTLAEIGWYAFSGCTSLSAIEIPVNVSTIGANAFDGCTALSSVTMHEGLRKIESGAFQNCDSLTTVQLPDSVTTLGGSVFCYCDNLETINYPLSLTTADRDNYSNCPKLTSITVPEGVTELADHAFETYSTYTSYLTSISLSSTLTEIGDYAFKGCRSLQTITLPNGLKAIGDSALEGCTALRGITLPDGLQFIGNDAFQDCTGLTRFSFPDSVSYIGFGVLSGCTNLTAVQYPSGLTDAESQGGVFRDCVNLHRIEIPNGVKTIHSNLFKESALQSVILPDSVTEIEHSAFFSCADLLYADIPASVKTMGYDIFEGCPHVTLYTEKRSAASIYAIDAGLPLVTTQTDAAFDRTVLTDDSAYTMELSANGYAQFTINCAADETLWPETYWQELLIRLPTCVSLNESTLKLDGVLCQNYVYDIDNRALTIPLEDRESPHAKVEFSVEITAQGDLSTYAALTYSRNSIRRTEYIDVINETMDRFTLRTEKIVSGSNIPVSGIAPAGAVVTLSVDDAVVGTATANRIGMYQTVLPIEETGENRAIRLQASCSDNAEALTIAQTVFWMEAAPQVTGFQLCSAADNTKSFDLYAHAQNGTRPLISDRIGTPRYIVTVTHPEQIDKLYVTNMRSNIKDHLEAAYDPVLGAFVAEGLFASNGGTPACLTVEYTLKHDTPTSETRIDWIDYLDKDYVDGAEVLYAAEDSDSEGIVDLSAVTGEADAQVHYAMEDLTEEAFAEWQERAETDAQIQSYSWTEGDTLFHFYLDAADPAEMIAVGAEVSGTGFKAYKFLVDVKAYNLPVGDPRYNTLAELSDTLGEYATAAGLITESLGIITDTEQLKAEIMQSSSITNKAEALRKADELAADRTAFMLMATLLPLAMGGGPPGAMLSLMLMAMSAASNSFWDLRTTQIKGTSCNVRWKVDPSGHVYDAETGKPLAGVTTTAYWIEYDSESTEYTYEEFYAAKPAEDTYGTLWDNAVEWAETNPLVTDENGWYAWDVPEGWWRVQYEKEGYVTAWSEWLPVLPIQTGVDIWLVPTEPSTFSIRAAERDDTSITVTATNYAAAADVRFILASYDVSGKLLECRLTEQTLSASGSAALTLPLNEDAARVRAYLLDPTTCKPLRSDWHLNIS